METSRLKQYCVLCETSSLRKSSELLGISHSGLSKSMKVLEEEVGFPLFFQSGRGIVISDEGKLLYEKAKKILKDIEALTQLETPKTSSTVRLGSFETFTSYFVGQLMRDYLPNREVVIYELIPGRLEEALIFNRVDLGITYEPIPRKGIEYLKVTSLLMGAFSKKDQFKGVPLEEVPFIVPSPPFEGAPSVIKGLDAWPDDKVKRNTPYRVDLLSTGLDLARLGLGAIFIPRFVAKLHNESVTADKRLEALSLPRGLASVRKDIYIVKRESSGEDKTIREVAKALRAICH